MKPKEPLLAVMLTFVFLGLGQIYSGRKKRGFLFMLIAWAPLALLFPFIYYIKDPDTTFNSISVIAGLFLSGIYVVFTIFVIVDSYLSVKKFNTTHNLERSLGWRKRCILILGILFFWFLLNPSEIIAGSLANIMRGNFVMAYKIPSESMAPTLNKGDKLFVDKAVYRKSDPQRGDVVVFLFPEDKSKDFIKRVVGLPGETVEIKKSDVYINGSKLKHHPFISNNKYYNEEPYGVYGEPVKVPDGHYYVLGDNSSMTRDSRYWGFVPREDITGKAIKVWYPLDQQRKIE